MNERENIEAAEKRVGEAAARMWDVAVMTTLLEAIRAPGVLEAMVQQNPTVATAYTLGLMALAERIIER
jgi:hypothetical protein